MPDVIIYLGPSLLQAEAEQILPSSPLVQYLPPIRRGEIQQAIALNPVIIAIIDGLFFENAAVGHREILAALRAGIRVVGASSMGALRAAELESFGMEGIGEIFRRYRDNIIESDDEVALICDPTTNIALSEALVNMRITLEKAVIEGVIDETESSSLLSFIQKQYYPERTWSGITRSDVLPYERREIFSNWLSENKVNQKRDDAIAALSFIRETLNTRPALPE